MIVTLDLLEIGIKLGQVLLTFAVAIGVWGACSTVKQVWSKDKGLAILFILAAIGSGIQVAINLSIYGR